MYKTTNKQTDNQEKTDKRAIIKWELFSVHCYQNHDQGSRIDCISSFCMHNSGLWVLIKNASQNCKTLRLWLCNKILKDVSGSTLWRVSRICLAIDEVGLRLTLGVVGVCWFISDLMYFGMCSAMRWDRHLSVLPIYLSPQLQVNWYTTCEVERVDELIPSFARLYPLVLNLNLNSAAGKVLATAAFNLRLVNPNY